MTLAPGGRVHFKSKFVRTREYELESQADTVLFRGTFRTQRPASVLSLPFAGADVCLNNAFDLSLKNAANTVRLSVCRLGRDVSVLPLTPTHTSRSSIHQNVLLWGDHLLAFFEAGGACGLPPILAPPLTSTHLLSSLLLSSHLNALRRAVPHRLDPRTLETLGTDDMGIGLRRYVQAGRQAGSSARDHEAPCIAAPHPSLLLPGVSGLPIRVEGLRRAAPLLHDAVFGQFATAHPKTDPALNRTVSQCVHTLTAMAGCTVLS